MKDLAKEQSTLWEQAKKPKKETTFAARIQRSRADGVRLK
jgi:hypothetical protein